MHAIILAGGFGTRLKAAVSDVPKPLAPIAGKPFLDWLIRLLARQGVTSVTLSVHHDWEKIRDYFAAHPPAIPVSYAVEEKPLGTGGAMAYALSSYPGVEPVLVLNGDSYARLDYVALFAHHRDRGSRLTLTLREVSDTGRYGQVEVKSGNVSAFREGNPGEKGLINAGVYVMHPQLFSQDDLPEAFSFERDFLPPMLETLKPTAFMAEDYFIDIGIPEDYARACRELPEMMNGD